MNLTDSREAELLLDWAMKNEESGVLWTGVDRNRESYYIDRDVEEKEILEYAPERISDFIELFREIWKKENDEKVMKVIAMAAIRLQQPDTKQEKAEKELVSKIPEYIYAL